ncbi:MAG: RNA-binding S4 domain-containing protein [Clostridia bacterium]|nr:RNA-binding S4 domain-containing protein [Clostridia bacterium]
MRLDKFLKISRIIKRRTVAKQICDASKIKINGKTAKSSTEVKPSDIITINIGAEEKSYRVLQVKEVVKKQEADELYEFIEHT